MDNPCKDCRDRWVTNEDRCHSTCEKYKAWRKERDSILNEERISNDAGRYDVQNYRNATKNKKRRRKRLQ